ncbi:MAG: DUF1670 domain-containing protein [Anaerolineaceae bacterium]|nr:DUF1670 domain-containing protein [Anaerolineaceae bacterium]MCB9101012.1 DUF1670 domain-containing protein [Anaerolineales bacterium]
MPDELIVLGSGSGLPTQRRFQSAYALRATSKLFLLDCGAPVSSLLYKHDLDPLDVRALFLSHWHMDHVANLGLLLTQNHLLNRSRALKIYGPRGTRSKIQRLLEDSFVLPDELSYSLKVTTVKSNETYTESLLQATFFRTQHLENAKYKTHFGRKAAAYGMIIDGPGWRMVYSGDLVSPHELSPYIEKCDLLIHEMAHHRPEEVAEFVAAAKIPHVLISHIGLEYDQTPEAIREAFAKYYNGDLMIAEDGMKLRLSQVGKRKSIEVKASKESSAKRQAKNFSTQNFKRQVARDQQDFLDILQKDFNLPFYLSRQILTTAQDMLVKPTHSMVYSGQVRATVTSLETPAAEDKPVEVVLTIDAGPEDDDVKQRERAVGLRRGRILRLLEQAVEQGGILSQDNLAQLLGIDLSTLRRDLASLEREGHPIYLLERLNGTSPGSSYKVRMVELWLDGAEPEEIAHRFHRSPQAVRRYVDKFAQVIKLNKEETTVKDITALTEIPTRLVENFLELSQTAQSKLDWQSKLELELQQQTEAN